MTLAFLIVMTAFGPRASATNLDTCGKDLQAQRDSWQTSPEPLTDRQQELFDIFHGRGTTELYLSVLNEVSDRAVRSFGIVRASGVRDGFWLSPPGAPRRFTVHRYDTVTGYRLYPSKLAMVRDALLRWAALHLADGPLRISFSAVSDGHVSHVERQRFTDLRIDDSGLVTLPDGRVVTESMILAGSIVVHYPAAKSLDGQISFEEEDANLGYAYGQIHTSVTEASRE